MKMTHAPLTRAFDAYIENAAEFSRPIFAHLREQIHEHCPAVVEAIKWGIPHFDYHGDMMCVFAAYNKHCSFTFVKESIMSDPRLRENPNLPATKRFMGKLTSLADLPETYELITLLQAAMKLNEQRVKLPARRAEVAAQIDMPPEFADTLAANAFAKAVFESRPPSFQKEYLIWIADAKTEATRQKRIHEALEWIVEGKGRFWKYRG